MVVSIGTDIVRIERIRRIVDKYPSFLEKVFTPDEILYCNRRGNPEQSYAARFAAKEAVMKALGTGWTGNLNWQDIEVVPDSQGKPEILLHNNAKQLLTELGADTIHCSLSHEKEYAIAFVIFTQQNA